MRKKLALTLLSCGLVAAVVCGRSDKAWKIFRHPPMQNRTLSVKDEAVQSVVRTKEGVWFGMPSGLLRYDGRKWTGYSGQDGLPGPIVWSLFAEGDSLLWIAAENGIAVRSKGHFLLDSAVNRTFRDGISILSTGDRVYLGTPAGIFSARPIVTAHSLRLDSLEPVRNAGAPESLYAGSLDWDPDTRSLWVGTHAGVVRIDAEGSWHLWSEKDQLPSLIVYDILWDRDNRCLWAATAAGLCRITEGGQVEKVSAQLSDSATTCLGRQGNQLWIGTLNGANLLDPATGKVRCFFENDGLANNAIRSILVDGKSVWFGCLLGGIARFQGES